MRTAPPLRFALLAKAAFSMFSTLLILTNMHFVETWLGVDAPLILPLIGIGLVIFAADLLRQATRR
jgi:uncharacterized membrane protein